MAERNTVAATTTEATEDNNDDDGNNRDCNKNKNCKPTEAFNIRVLSLITMKCKTDIPQWFCL